MEKLDEFNIGCKIIFDFVNHNNFVMPTIVIKKLAEKYGYYDFETPNVIFIDTLKINKMSKTNHPMMVYDASIIGTMIHEFGHFIDLGIYKGHLTKSFKKIKSEPLLHYFETDIREDVAESIRLFILHPERLKKGRPKRYKIINKYFLELPNIYESHLFNNYIPKNEKIDIEKWEKFLV